MNKLKDEYKNLCLFTLSLLTLKATRRPQKHIEIVRGIMEHAMKITQRSDNTRMFALIRIYCSKTSGQATGEVIIKY